MDALRKFTRTAATCVALLIGGPVPAQEPPPAPSDPQILEFLGELGGEEALFILYTTSREAKKVAKDAAEDTEAETPPAEAAPEAVAWETLDAPVQALLAGQADRWAMLLPAEQRAFADGAQRWLALDGIGRAQANDRWETWRSLTPDQRERVRKAWARFRALSPRQQQAVRTSFLQFPEMPLEQRVSLLERMQQMSPEELRRALNRRQGPKPGTLDKRPCPPC